MLTLLYVLLAIVLWLGIAYGIFWYFAIRNNASNGDGVDIPVFFVILGAILWPILFPVGLIVLLVNALILGYKWIFHRKELDT